MSTAARQLAQRHAEIFERGAISADFARQLGVFSVERRSDLPDDLAGYSAAYPGFVVPLRNLDGEIFHQVRLDNPTDGSKALQPQGSGSIITIHPPMAERVGVADRILFVEGTRQTIAVMIHAPEDWLVVGLQGCQNWKLEGVPHPDLTRLGVDGSEIVILFDADLATNRDVNLAARQLGDHMRNLGAAKVRFAATPGGAKTGVDDYLGMSFSNRDDRSRVVLRIIESAADKAPRVPAARLKPPARLYREGLTCVMRRGVTVVPGNEERPEKLVMAAAARLAEVTTILDPDDPDRVIPAQLKVEVAIPSTEGVTRFVVEVPDDRLADIGGLFNATRSGLALNLQRPTSAVAEREVANAIRACESDRTAHSSAYRRLGWILDDEGTWRYLHTKGALGPHDTREDLRAWMPPKSRCIGCIDPGRFDCSQIAEYTRMSIDNLDLLVDRTPWLALLGCVGIAPSGVVPNAAVGLVGPQAAGKLLPLNTQIPTPDGFTDMGALQVGDQVFGRDGRPCTVTYLSPVDSSPTLFDMLLADGQVIRACADHQWIVVDRKSRRSARTKKHRRAIRRWEAAMNTARALEDLANQTPDVDATGREVLTVAERVTGFSIHTPNVLVKLLKRCGCPISSIAGRTQRFPLAIALKVLAAHLCAKAGDCPDDGETEVVLTTLQIADALKYGDGYSRFAVRLTDPIDGPQIELPVDPWVLGVWLGDGKVGAGEITVGAEDLADMRAILDQLWPSYSIRQERNVFQIGLHRPEPDRCLRGHEKTWRCADGYFMCPTCSKARRRHETQVEGWNVSLREKLAGLGVLHQKHIPRLYMRASAAQRLALLQGLMDTDGYVSKHGFCELTLNDNRLIGDALEVVRSLGIRASVSSGPAAITERDPNRPGRTRRRVTGVRQRIHFTTNQRVFRLARKADRLPVDPQRRSGEVAVVAIMAAPSEPGRCIQVDSADHAYLVGRGYVPTHNTGILCSATAFLSPELAYERKVMTTADATAASIDLALSGHDYSFVLLDDFHPEFDPREQARQVKALDAALRRAHGAPSKGRAQLANSVVEQASVNESHPVVLLSFEQLPAAAKSGLDRALTIEVTRSSTFKPGAFTDFAATGQSGALQVAYFGYLRYLARRVASGPIELAEWLEWNGTQRWPGDPEAAMREWVLFVETARDNFSRRVAERVPGATSRAHRVVGSLLVGLGLWLDYARTVDAVSDDEFDAVSSEGFNSLVAAIDTHNEVALEGNLPAHEHILELIRSAVASGQAIVGQDDSPIGRAVRIGTFTEVLKTEFGPKVRVLALDTHVQIPGCPPNWANALRPICLPEPSSGKPFRQIRVGGSKPRCAVIPLEMTGIEEPSRNVNDEPF